jgi:hypothetical protein
MDDKPSTGMHVLVSNSLGFTVELKFQVAWREDVKCGWSSILDNKSGLLSFGDDSAESCERVGNGFWVRTMVRYGVLMVSSICFFLVENMKERGIGCLKAKFINLWVIIFR